VNLDQVSSTSLSVRIAVKNWNMTFNSRKKALIFIIKCSLIIMFSNLERFLDGAEREQPCQGVYERLWSESKVAEGEKKK
jgi:hypothetical protein